MSNDDNDGLDVELYDQPGDTVRDDGLLAAILGGATYEEAARESGYSMSTVSRRMHDPRFRRRLLAARAQLQEATLTALHHAGSVGVRALLEAAQGAPPTVEETIDGEGNVVKVRRLGVPWSTRVMAGRALAELSIGVLARQLPDPNAADGGEVLDAEDELDRVIAAYQERLPSALKVIEGTATDGAPDSDTVSNSGTRRKGRAKKAV